jgi:threonyl-tRNA synthetase
LHSVNIFAGLQKDYATEVAQSLWDKGIFAEADVSPETLKKKILNAEIARWNFILGESSWSPS